MDRIKSIALTTFGIIVALAGLGLFASIGLAMMGALVVLGTVAAITVALGSLFSKAEPQTAEAA